MHQHQWRPRIVRAGVGLAIVWRCRCGAVDYEASAADRRGGAGRVCIESRQPGVLTRIGQRLIGNLPAR